VGAALRGLEEVLEGDVDKRKTSFGEQLAGVPEFSSDVHAAALLLFDPRAHRKRVFDAHRPAITEKHTAGYRRKAVPGRHEPARLVDERGDEPTVDQSRATLMALVEREVRLVAIGSLGLRLWEVEAERVVSAPEARGVVVRWDLQRMPPRSKCALKKFSEPDVAMADEAEISSASVAAATIWAKR
jgi:hypothetical protein